MNQKNTPKEYQELDYIENIYTDHHTLIDDDKISDWEEGFMKGYAQA